MKKIQEEDIQFFFPEFFYYSDFPVFSSLDNFFMLSFTANFYFFNYFIESIIFYLNACFTFSFIFSFTSKFLI